MTQIVFPSELIHFVGIIPPKPGVVLKPPQSV
jgi:hypothetical protein